MARVEEVVEIVLCQVLILTGAPISDIGKERSIKRNLGVSN